MNMNKFYVGVVLSLLSDLVGKSYSETERKLDAREIKHRVKTQGIEFLTKTLPRFGKAVDSALAKGTPLTVHGFKLKHGTKLPEFLWGLTSQVFDQNGCELPLGNAHVLRSLRQISYLFYKLELPYDENTTKSVLDSFVEVDEALTYKGGMLRGVDSEIIKGARRLIARVLANANPRDILPRHGPGAVADGLKPHEKPNLVRYNSRLGSYYCYGNYFHYNDAHLTDSLNRFLDLPEFEVPARVVLVPKDSRGPRLISCEPTENQWIQQGQCRILYDTIENHPLTAGHVNFTEQLFNQWYAWLGSRDGSLVTLDMKEASDRVSLELVKELFPPNWVEALEASRSTHTLLPDGRCVKMNKFAPMGSAVCFPVESLIFFALGVSAIMCTHNVSLSEAKRLTYVYGDDIVVDRVYHAALLQFFPKVGLMFNDGKCCTTGFFRESCGIDAYRGTNVTPVKIHSVYAVRRSSNGALQLTPGAYASYVAHSNEFYRRGYYHTAAFIERNILMFFPDTPQFTELGGVIAFVRHDRQNLSLLRSRCKTRFNANLHRHEVKGWFMEPVDKTVSHPSYADLLAKVASCGESNDSNLDRPVLGVYALPRRNRLKQRWTPVA